MILISVMQQLTEDGWMELNRKNTELHTLTVALSVNFGVDMTFLPQVSV